MPDGVTLLAPYEQYQPTDYPGLRTGDPAKAMALFDLSTDPAEQHNVADAHPDQVKRLKALYRDSEGEISTTKNREQNNDFEQERTQEMGPHYLRAAFSCFSHHS